MSKPMYSLDEDVYVVSGREFGGYEFDPDFFIVATYSNYESALAHAKYIAEDVLEVVERGDTIFVHGESTEATIEKFTLKEEFDND